MRTDMDYLVLENFFLLKAEQPDRLLTGTAIGQFELD